MPGEAAEHGADIWAPVTHDTCIPHFWPWPGLILAIAIYRGVNQQMGHSFSLSLCILLCVCVQLWLSNRQTFFFKKGIFLLVQNNLKLCVVLHSLQFYSFLKTTSMNGLQNIFVPK